MMDARERLIQDLQAALRRTRVELERVEVLAAAIRAFSSPVPDYRPRLHRCPAKTRDIHTKTRALDRFELSSGNSSN